MKQSLFQIAVLLHEYEETEKEGKKYKSSKIVIDPKFVLGKDQKEILFKITREIPEEFVSNPDDIEILVRNFLVAPVTSGTLSIPKQSHFDQLKFRNGTTGGNDWIGSQLFTNSNIVPDQISYSATQAYSLTDALKQ